MSRTAAIKPRMRDQALQEHPGDASAAGWQRLGRRPVTVLKNGSIRQLNPDETFVHVKGRADLRGFHNCTGSRLIEVYHISLLLLVMSAPGCRMQNPGASGSIQTKDATQLNRVCQTAVSQACSASSGSFCRFQYSRIACMADDAPV